MKLAVRPTGGTAPEAPCRAPCNAPASGGGACRRLSPPKERQRRSRKRHSFLSRTRLRGQIEPWIFFCEIAGGKVTVIRLTLGSVDGHALQIDELKSTKPTEKIDLSQKNLGIASAIIIASCIKENRVLKELKCATPKC